MKKLKGLFTRQKLFLGAVALCVVAVAVAAAVYGSKPPVDETLPTMPENTLATADLPPLGNMSTEPATESAPPIEPILDSMEPEDEPVDAEPVAATVEVQPETQPETQPSTQPATTPAAVVSYIPPVTGEITANYSEGLPVYSQTMRDWRTHDGVDIAAPVGTQVKCAADGEVTAIYNDLFLGTTVEVKHADGCVTRYCNLLEKVTVAVGQQLKRGDVIGGVGETSITECVGASHLHFELLKDDEHLDPTPLLWGD